MIYRFFEWPGDPSSVETRLNQISEAGWEIMSVSTVWRTQYWANFITCRKVTTADEYPPFHPNLTRKRS